MQIQTLYVFARSGIESVCNEDDYIHSSPEYAPELDNVKLP